MAKVVYISGIRKALAAKKCKSQWERGCAELAEEAPAACAAI